MPVPSVSIRGASNGDLSAVSSLLVAAGLPLDGLDEQFGSGYAVAIGGADLDTVGAAGIEVYGEVGLLRSAVVDPAWRGRGVGVLLTEDRLAWAAERGLKEVWLLTTTAADFFPRFGFATSARHLAPAAVQLSREFAEACPASAVAMRLRFPD